MRKTITSHPPELPVARDMRVLRQVAELPTLTIAELSDRWQALMGTVAPHGNKDFLVKRLAYRLQELAYGGVSEPTRQRMRDILGEGEGETRPHKRGRPAHADTQLMVGTRLTRIWHEQRYEVVVITNGYEYAGQRYKTLSAVVKAITGQHASGPAFFGLKK
jgi:hypothetical protein